MTFQLFYLFKAPGNLFSQTAFYYSSVSHRMEIYSRMILGGTVCDDLSVTVRNWGAMCCCRGSSFRNKTISKHNCGPFALENLWNCYRKNAVICPELQNLEGLFNLQRPQITYLLLPVNRTQLLFFIYIYMYFVYTLCQHLTLKTGCRQMWILLLTSPSQMQFDKKYDYVLCSGTIKLTVYT